MSSKSSQPITCRGAVCWGAGEPLVMEEIQVEPPQAEEVRIRVLRASICHTDFLFWNGYPISLYPRVVGHEGVGIIESVGEGVTDLKVGDTVIPTFLGECKECRNCKSNKTNICLRYPLTLNGLMQDETSRMSVRGQRLYHAFTCSTFCEFTVVNINYVAKVDLRVPLSHASLLSCGFSTGYGAVWKEAKIEKGSSVAIFGLGGVGLGAVIGAKLLGAEKIIGVDLNDARKEKATDFGMTDFLNPRDIDNKSISAVIREMTGGLGVDYSFECSGAAPLLNEAFEATAPGIGLTIVVGTSQQLTTSISTLEFVAGKTIKGSLFGGIKPPSDLNTIVGKCTNKEIELGGLVTHEVEFSNINSAFEILKQPDCIKVIIKISKSEDRRPTA